MNTPLRPSATPASLIPVVTPPLGQSPVVGQGTDLAATTVVDPLGIPSAGVAGAPAVLRAGMVGDLRRRLTPLTPEIDLLHCNAFANPGTATNLSFCMVSRPDGPVLLATASGRTYAFRLSEVGEEESPYIGEWSARKGVECIIDDGQGGTLETQKNYLVGTQVCRYAPNGDLLWTREFDRYSSANGLIMRDGVPVVYNNGAFHYLNLQTGEVLQSVPCPNSMPSGRNGLMGDQMLICHSDRILVVQDNGAIRGSFQIPKRYGALSDGLDAFKDRLLGVAFDSVTQEIFLALGDGVYVYNTATNQWSLLTLPEMSNDYYAPSDPSGRFASSATIFVNAFHFDPNTRTLLVGMEMSRPGCVYQSRVSVVTPEQRVLEPARLRPTLESTTSR